MFLANVTIVTDHGISVEIFSKNINHLNFKEGLEEKFQVVLHVRRPELSLRETFASISFGVTGSLQDTCSKSLAQNKPMIRMERSFRIDIFILFKATFLFFVDGFTLNFGLQILEAKPSGALRNWKSLKFGQKTS